MAKKKSSEIPMFDAIPQDAEPAEMSVRRERQQAAFLAALGPRGWRAALAEAGVGDEQVYRWLRRDEAFKEALADTRDATALRLEQIADAIASGEQDASPAQVTLLQFRLRGLRPETYRDRASVQVDQRTTIAAESGDGSKARLLLAEWEGDGAAAASCPVKVGGAAAALRR